MRWLARLAIGCCIRRLAPDDSKRRFKGSRRRRTSDAVQVAVDHTREQPAPAGGIAAQHADAEELLGRPNETPRHLL
jgi:hypothetical protein